MRLGSPGVRNVRPHTVTVNDFLLGDDDEVVFVPLDRAADVAEGATAIRDTERAQAARMQPGNSLRNQVDFAGYLAAREADPEVTFRQYLRSVGGEIEE